jgi:hypothetical protein
MKILVYEKDSIIKDLDFIANNNISIKEFYQDIKKAINSSNMQSIWQLSKIITRHQLHNK